MHARLLAVSFLLTVNGNPSENAETIRVTNDVANAHHCEICQVVAEVPGTATGEISEEKIRSLSSCNKILQGQQFLPQQVTDLRTPTNYFTYCERNSDYSSETNGKTVLYEGFFSIEYENTNKDHYYLSDYVNEIASHSDVQPNNEMELMDALNPKTSGL